MPRKRSQRKTSHRKQSHKSEGVLGGVKKKVENTWEGVKDVFTEG